jgi:hypothetical protein
MRDHRITGVEVATAFDLRSGMEDKRMTCNLDDDVMMSSEIDGRKFDGELHNMTKCK